MTALKNIKWLQDVYVTRKEEMHFEVDESIKKAFDEVIDEFELLEIRLKLCKMDEQDLKKRLKNCCEPKNKNETCRWERDRDYDVYYAECAFNFQFSDDRESITEHDFVFCPKCGRKIVEKKEV